MPGERTLWLWWSADVDQLWLACADLVKVVDAVAERDPDRWLEAWHKFFVRRENGDTAEGTITDLYDMLIKTRSYPVELSGERWGMADDDDDEMWDSSMQASARWDTQPGSWNLTLELNADKQAQIDRLLTDVLDVIESRGGIQGVRDPRPEYGSSKGL